jgi:hypothetical protein
MHHQRRDDLRDKARAAGLGTYELSVILDEPAGTTQARLGGYIPLTEKHEIKILKAIAQVQATKKCVTTPERS